MIDTINTLVEKYLDSSDWKVKENSNQSFCYSNLMNHLSNFCIKEYGLQSIYTEKQKEYHEEGRIHIHDLGGSIVGYCSGWSIKQLLTLGLNCGPERMHSTPPGNLTSVVGQLVNFLGIMSNEWMGAQAFSDVDIYLAPFIHKAFRLAMKDIGDEEKARVVSMRYVENEIQSLLYHIGQPQRWGGQSPFTNFTLALVPPKDMVDEPCIVGGKMYTDPITEEPLCYGDMQEYINIFNKCFFDVYNRGDGSGKPFTFPVLTVNLSESWFNGDIDKEVIDVILECNRIYGGTYFQNCINGKIDKDSSVSPTDTRSMCCRLNIKVSDLEGRVIGLFGASEYVGSIGVVTLNLPMIGYEAKSKEEFYEKLDDACETAKECLLLKRDRVIQSLNMGLMPYTKRYLPYKNFETFFLTIGYIGMHEMLLNMGYKDGIVGDEGAEVARQILIYLREKVNSYKKEYDVLFNFEAVPAEGAMYRLAMLSKKKYPDLIAPGEEDPYFTNSCHLPVQYQGDISRVISHQSKLQKYHSGGTVVHFYLGSEPTKRQLVNILKKVSKTEIPYFTITPVFSICPVHGRIPGAHEFCPYCV